MSIINPVLIFSFLSAVNLLIPAAESAPRIKSHKSSMPRAMQDPNLFQGDIVVLPVVASVRTLSSSLRDEHRIPDATVTSQLWPEAVIYYQFALRDEGLRQLIRRAMDHIEKRTCIRFEERTFLLRLRQKRDFVTIFQGRGCYSVVGRTRGSQPLSLGPGCENENIIVHELMHAIGFFHKHSRHDRDEFLDIHWDNIEKKMWQQFDKVPKRENSLSTPFDYMSVMLYGPTTFSFDDFSTTMSRKDGGRLIDIPFKNGLSPDDIAAANSLYNCPKREEGENEIADEPLILRQNKRIA